MAEGSGVSSDERTMALLIHVLGIFTGFIGALIIWLIKREDSNFIDHHGRQALNFQFTMLIAQLVSWVLVIVLIGVFLLMAIYVIVIVFSIIAALEANKGNLYRYPLSIPFFKTAS